MSEGLAQGR